MPFGLRSSTEDRSHNAGSVVVKAHPMPKITTNFDRTLMPDRDCRVFGQALGEKANRETNVNSNPAFHFWGENGAFIITGGPEIAGWMSERPSAA